MSSALSHPLQRMLSDRGRDTCCGDSVGWRPQPCSLHVALCVYSMTVPSSWNIASVVRRRWAPSLLGTAKVWRPSMALSCRSSTRSSIEWARYALQACAEWCFSYSAMCLLRVHSIRLTFLVCWQHCSVASVARIERSNRDWWSGPPTLTQPVLHRSLKLADWCCRIPVLSPRFGHCSVRV
jgi:hypothetical protein